MQKHSGRTESTKTMNSLALTIFIGLTGTAFLWQATDGLQALTAEGARRIAIEKQKPVVPAVTLETMTGDLRKLNSSDGKIVLLEFIYTTCPIICQDAGADLGRIRDALVRDGFGNRFAIYSVSFDLTTDTVESMKLYGKAHGADGNTWTVAKPSKQALPALLSLFGVIVIPNEYGGYEHNAALHVINSKGQLSKILEIDDVDGAITTVKRMIQG